MNEFITITSPDYSNLMTQLTIAISNLDYHILRYATFIADMNNLQALHNVYVVPDGFGGIELNSPGNMPEETVSYLAKKAGVIDRLVISQSDAFGVELEKARGIETSIKRLNPNYTTSISGQVAEMARLRGGFK